jgi:pimeloyl-ACP methyl ester carboxylesterase
MRRPTPDGWTLHFNRVRGEGEPVLMVPGFAMNPYILGFHPRGRSFMQYIADSGFDAWSVELRGLGRNKGGRRRNIGLAERALVDLPHAIAHVREATGAERVHLIGCSLGGSIVYSLLAHEPDADVGKVVSIGGPLWWKDPPVLVRAYARLGPVIGRVPIRGTRHLAKAALPVISRAAPGLLGLYLNHNNVDLSQPDELVKTVEDPAPRVNRQLAAWIRSGRLTIRGMDIVAGVGQVQNPLLLVTGSGDGIAPLGACDPVLDAWGGPSEHLHVDGEHPWSHADLFIGHEAEPKVFAPIADFLSS